MNLQVFQCLSEKVDLIDLYGSSGVGFRLGLKVLYCFAFDFFVQLSSMDSVYTIKFYYC